MKSFPILIYSGNPHLKKLSDHSKGYTPTLYVNSICECYHSLFKKKKQKFGAIFIATDTYNKDLTALMECIENQRLSDNLRLATENQALRREASPKWQRVDDLASSYRATIEQLSTTLRKRFNRQYETNSTSNSLETIQREYEVLLEGAGEGIIGLDENGCITFANKTASELLGVERSLLIAEPFTKFSLDSPLKSGSKATSFLGKNNSKSRVGRGAIQRPDQSLVYVEFTLSYVGNQDSNTVSIMVIEDISERIKFETKLMKMAHTDTLTGLYNRYYFEKTLNKEMSSRRSFNQPLVLALIDLDGFKNINDQHGHAMGDKLLIMAAKRIKDCIRRSDLVARLGGDEFCILFKDLEPDAVNKLLAKITFQLALPFTLDQLTVQISASIGFCCAEENQTLKTLLAKADSAMYSVKRQGKNGVANYDAAEALPAS